jgi:hypothetical protein
MPWEAGYFDGIKAKVAVVPILSTAIKGEGYERQEYLGLYPYVTLNRDPHVQKPALYSNENEDPYVMFSRWRSKVKGLLSLRQPI